MPRTIESILASHHAATERRNTGRPVWEHTIRLGAVFHNDEMTFEQRRDAIVQIIKGSGWADTTSDAYELERLLDDLACADSIGEFDDYWDELYDLADADRVWIGTR